MIFRNQGSLIKKSNSISRDELIDIYGLNSYEFTQKNKEEMQRAAEARQKKSSVGRMAGSVIGNIIAPGIGGAIGNFVGGLFCDIRLKEDIAPLQKSEVNDVLSECAFFVKDLNECS